MRIDRLDKSAVLRPDFEVDIAKGMDEEQWAKFVYDIPEELIDEVDRQRYIKAYRGGLTGISFKLLLS